MDREGVLRLWEITPGDTLEDRVVNFAHKMEYAYNIGHMPDFNVLADLLSNAHDVAIRPMAVRMKGKPDE